jgi:hypothetical protein
MTLSDYHKLKSQIVQCFGSNDRPVELLSAIKEKYRDIINSPRRFEQVYTIGMLLKVLEIRDVLSEHNIGPLKEIVSRITDNKDLMQNINDYQLSHVPPELVNYYGKYLTINISRI